MPITIKSNFEWWLLRPSNSHHFAAWSMAASLFPADNWESALCDGEISDRKIVTTISCSLLKCLNQWQRIDAHVKYQINIAFRFIHFWQSFRTAYVSSMMACFACEGFWGDNDSRDIVINKIKLLWRGCVKILLVALYKNRPANQWIHISHACRSKSAAHFAYFPTPSQNANILIVMLRANFHTLDARIR